MTKVYNKSDVFSQHGNPCDSAHLRGNPLCPEHHTLSWSEVNLRQHPWVRTTAPSSKYLSVTVNDAVKSVYWHQACTCLHIYTVISPFGLVLSTTLTGLLQKAGARLPNTGPDTEQRMFKSHKIWILGTGRTTLGHPSIFKRAASLNSCLLTVFVFYLALNNKSETNTRACHWLGNANFWSRNPNYWIIIIIIIIIPNNQY